MKLYIVRHGETNWNKERKIQGQVDIPLNEFGRKLAVKTQAGLSHIPFAVCFTSPLGRAKETAAIILDGKDVPIIEDQRIVEMAFGIYEGKCCSKSGWNVPEDFKNFFNDTEHYAAPKGGENFADVIRRTGAFLAELYENEELESQNVLITTHGAALAGMLITIKNKPLSEFWGMGVHKNCAVTEVEVNKKEPVIISENVVYYDDYVEPWEE